MSIRSTFVQFLDNRLPTVLSRLRYQYHVAVKGDIVYPRVTKVIFHRLSSSGKIAYDVGANVGIYSRYLSSYFSKVVSVEPIAYLSEHLKRSLPSNCRVEAMALGEHDGEIVLRIPVDSAGREMPALTTAATDNSLQFVPNAGAVERKVAVKKLDSLVSADVPLAFVKIDVEGFEDAVLAGAGNTLTHQRPVLQIEISRAHNPNYKSTLDRMRNFNYQGYSLRKDGLYTGDLKYIETQSTKFTEVDAASPEGMWDYLFVPSERCASLLDGLIRG